MDDVRSEKEVYDSVRQVRLIDEYQAMAERFVNHALSERDLLSSAAMGVAGEAGEVADAVKKVLYHGHPLNRFELEKELGDVLWYVALCCTVLGVPMSEVAATNIRKLSARYPDGFSCERSLHREC